MKRLIQLLAAVNAVLLLGYGVRLLLINQKEAQAKQALLEKSARGNEVIGVMRQQDGLRLHAISMSVNRTGAISDADLAYCVSLIKTEPLFRSSTGLNGPLRRVDATGVFTGLKIIPDAQRPVLSDTARYLLTLQDPADTYGSDCAGGFILALKLNDRSLTSALLPLLNDRRKPVSKTARKILAKWEATPQ